MITNTGNTKIADLLLQNGAKINVGNDMGETPLLLAVKSGKNFMCEIMVAKKKHRMRNICS